MQVKQAECMHGFIGKDLCLLWLTAGTGPGSSAEQGSVFLSGIVLILSPLLCQAVTLPDDAPLTNTTFSFSLKKKKSSILVCTCVISCLQIFLSEL